MVCYVNVYQYQCYACTACDDARIRVWRIPEGGLTTTLTEPEAMLIGVFYLGLPLIVFTVCVFVCRSPG